MASQLKRALLTGDYIKAERLLRAAASAGVLSPLEVMRLREALDALRYGTAGPLDPRVVRAVLSL